MTAVVMRKPLVTLNALVRKKAIHAQAKSFAHPKPDPPHHHRESSRGADVDAARERDADLLVLTAYATTEIAQRRAAGRARAGDRVHQCTKRAFDAVVQEIAWITRLD